MSKIYYVRPAIKLWETLAVGFGQFEMRLSSPAEGCIGAMLVYDSREAFDKQHPGETPIFVQEPEPTASTEQT